MCCVCLAQVRGFQAAAKEALRKQIQDATLFPQMATAAPPPDVEQELAEASAAATLAATLAAQEQEVQQAKAKQAKAQKEASKARAKAQAQAQARQLMAQAQYAQPTTAPAYAMEAAPMMIGEAAGAVAHPMLPAAAATIASPNAVGAGVIAPADSGRPVTWQDHLIGWRIEAQQYTSGAIVRGTVNGWDVVNGQFTLSFENGSVEQAYLPQASVFLIDATGERIDWNQYFELCKVNGVVTTTEPPPGVAALPAPPAGAESGVGSDGQPIHEEPQYEPGTAAQLLAYAEQEAAQ